MMVKRDGEERMVKRVVKNSERGCSNYRGPGSRHFKFAPSAR